MAGTLAAALAAQQSAAQQQPQQPQQQQPAPIPLAHIMARASQWTARFEQSLSGLLFREQYRQHAVTGSIAIAENPELRLPPGTAPAAPGATRLLEANVFMLRPPGGRNFVVYRDVYRVNSRDITDHTARLQKLLADGTSSSIAQARRLTDASAAHNTGGFDRNINVPTIVLEYLDAAQVGRLEVREAGRDRIDGLDVLMVDFEEVGRPTVVRGRNGVNVPATGRFWIHPGSGAVPRAMAQFTIERTRGRIDVRLELHDTLSVWVPKEMAEVWQGRGHTVTGLAHYDRFQRLNVSTAEIIK